LDALQASILDVKQKYLDQWSEGRKQRADIYRDLFQKAGLDDIMLPVERGNRHIYNYYVIKVGQRRDDLREYLTANGIGSEIYYPLSLHEQDCFKYLGYKTGDFPVSEKAAKSTIALPIYPELTIEQQGYVVDTIKEFLKDK
jgi:dTDP-4-amino-4,6-dideoxygalactose transaminase